MVDTRVTSHIITEIQKFKRSNDTFQPEKHSVELAYGTRASGVALRRGDAGGLRGKASENLTEECAVCPIVSTRHLLKLKVTL